MSALLFSFSVLVLLRLEEPNGMLLAELQKWERRQVQLCSIIEQLKWRDCKSVLTSLLASKSRLIKRWKAVDVQ